MGDVHGLVGVNLGFFALRPLTAGENALHAVVPCSGLPMPMLITFYIAEVTPCQG